jgi:hypothetical protein
MPDHSPEPWTFDDDGEVWDIRGAEGYSVFSHEGYCAEDNARRIVACVNACRHLPTEFLDRWPEGLGAVGLALAQTHAPRRKLEINGGEPCSDEPS